MYKKERWFMTKFIPSFIFSGQCVKAIELYKKAFGAEEIGRMLFSEMSPRLIQYKDEQKNFIYQCQLKIGEQIIVLADDNAGWMSDDVQIKTGQSMMQNIKVRFDSDSDLQAAYKVLADGGSIIMPMKSTSYAESQVFLVDRFGGRWELLSPPKPGKCLSVGVIAPMAHELFKNAGFDYCICGGYALDMFAGKEIRPHGDFDIVVFKEDKLKAIQFLMDNNWPVYIRFATADDFDSFKQFHLISDINDSRLDDDRGGFWSVKPESFMEMIKKEGTEDAYTYYVHEPRLQGFDFIEIAFDVREGNDFVLLEEPRVTRAMDKAILYKNGIPYLAPEIVLFFKSDKFSSEHPYLKPKTEFDFKAIMPLLSGESRAWLLNAIETAHPDGYEWLDGLL